MGASAKRRADGQLGRPPKRGVTAGDRRNMDALRARQSAYDHGLLDDSVLLEGARNPAGSNASAKLGVAGALGVAGLGYGLYRTAKRMYESRNPAVKAVRLVGFVHCSIHGLLVTVNSA